MVIKKKNKSDLQCFDRILIVLFAAIYIYQYSLYLSFANSSMQGIYILLVVLVCFLTPENILYIMFFMLPMRKLIYFGTFNFYNILLLVYLIKMFMKNRSIPKIPFLCAVFLACYDVLISMISLPEYTVSAYMIKWYLGFFTFLYMLQVLPQKYDYRKGILYLNIGLLIVGILTMSQYMGYDVITGGLRERLAGAGGTLDQNTYSFHCLMGAISAFSFLLDSEKKKSNNVYNMEILALGIFNLVCGMYMVSKGFYVVVAILLVLILVKMESHIIKYFKYIVIIAIGIFLLLRVNRVQQLITSIVLRFSGATDASSLTTGRSDLYSYYINALLLNPLKMLFGAGLNTYRLVYNAHNHYITHNTTLELIVSWGLPIAICLVGVIVYLSKKHIFKGRDKNLFTLLPLITLLLFSQTVAMFWEDASLFYLVFALYSAVRLVPEKGESIEKLKI